MTRPVVTQGDIGHDLTTINLLLSKHKALEQEIVAHEKTLQESMSPGRELIEQGIWGAEKIQQRLDEVSSNWTKLIEMMNQRKTRLTEAVDFHQVSHHSNYPNQYTYLYSGRNVFNLFVKTSNSKTLLFVD